MTDMEKRTAAKEFAAVWQGRGDEKQETQTFWLSLLRKVYGVADPGQFIDFEVRVKLDHTSFIDGLIKDTRVLIEQKGQDTKPQHPLQCSTPLGEELYKLLLYNRRIIKKWKKMKF